LNGWLEERREQRRRRARLARRIGIPLFSVLLVVSLVSAPLSFIDASRYGDFRSWFTFVSNIWGASVSAVWLWVFCRTNHPNAS
jgi:hypothetical protein